MSIVFVFGSEEELSSGVEWCEQRISLQGTKLHLVVPGNDRKSIAELARRRASERLGSVTEKIHVELVESSPSAVGKYARSIGCDALLMVYRDDDAKFQQQLFEESTVATLWLRSCGAPPDSADQTCAVLRRPSRTTAIACERLLGFVPPSTRCDDLSVQPDDFAAIARSCLESEVADDTLRLAVFDVEHARPHDRVYQSGLSLLKQPPRANNSDANNSDANGGENAETGSSEVLETYRTSIALVHPGDTLLEALAAKVRHWSESVAPPMERDQRIELSEDLQSGSLPNLEFLGLISASAMLASFGLLQNSASVIIGAMLIAPLMTPILGAGLALTQGNRPLFQSSIWTILLGFAGALISSVLFGWLYLCFHEPTVTEEMWARCRPSPLDFCVGMVGGIAASYARTRSHLSSALAGAAIAAALIPPIATAGLQVAFWEWEEVDDGIPILGPLLLVSVNVLTIMIGSSFVLWARGMRGDRSRPVKDRWVLRMIAMLTLLALLILIRTLHPFPSV